MPGVLHIWLPSVLWLRDAHKKTHIILTLGLQYDSILTFIAFNVKILFIYKVFLCGIVTTF